MGVFDNLKKMFGTKEQTLSESFNAAVEAEYRRMEKIREKRGSRQNHVNECIALMKDCRTKFTQVIAEERKIAMKKNHNGIPDSRERTRIREAAIGILTVDMALFDLESISSEAELNAAMNQMGKALWQMIRLDQTNGGISASSRSFIDLFYPSFKGMVEEQETYTLSKKTKETVQRDEAIDIMSMYEIPKDIRDRIDDTFVENLMQGDGYAMAMYKARNNPVTKKDTVHAERFDAHDDGMINWDRINELADQADDLDLGNESYKKFEGMQ